MKILLIANAYPTRSDPDYMVFIQNIESSLEPFDCQIDRIVIAGRSHTLAGKALKYARFYFRLLVARLSKYDCIYLHLPSHCALPLLVRSWRRHKFVVHLHGCDLVPRSKIALVSWIYRRLTLCAARKARLAIVPSRYFKGVLHKLTRTRAICVYPSGGVNRTVFSPNGPPPGQFEIGYVGHVLREKGIEVLLKAVSLLKIPYHLSIVGNCPELTHFQRICEESDIQDKVDFVGPGPHGQLSPFFNGFSVLVFPTMLQESFGLVGIEAMACGVPVIGSRIGALPEYIRDGVNGLLFEPGNPQALAEAITRFYHSSSAKKQALGRESLETARRYDSNHVTADFVVRFRQAVGQEVSSMS